MTKNILWYDSETSRVKIASHVCFNEEMNNLPIDKIPPNVQHLQHSEEVKSFEAEEEDSQVTRFHMYSNPFAYTFKKKMNL